MRVGFCNGLLLGTVSFVLIGLLYLLYQRTAAGVCLCGIRLHRRFPVLAMLISSAVGTLIPLFFKKINVDPAVASGPLITTVNDLVAVVTYYGLSWLLLLNVMHFGA